MSPLKNSAKLVAALHAVGVALQFSLVAFPAFAQQCHPSYDPCVPIASDVDCAGGNGNGPVYVDGPIKVIGPDEYQLDRDGDGIACDR